MRSHKLVNDYVHGYDAAARDDAAEFKKLDARIAELEAALVQIRDTLPIEQDNYSRRVFAIACEALRM